MPNPNDLRVIKTQQNIRQSFLYLLERHDFQDITIAHILAQANINRSTFYKHYANKNDLAKRLIDGLIDEHLTPVLVRYLHLPFLELLSQLITHLQPHRTLIEQLYKINTPAISTRHQVYQLICRQYITQNQATTDSLTNLRLQGYLYASSLLAFFEILIQHDDITADELLANAALLSAKII